MNEKTTKKLPCIFEVSALFIVVLTLLVACDSKPPASNSISGRVFKSDGKTPVSQVTVEAWADNPWAVRGTAMTDAQGRYTINELASGEYIVSAKAAGYRYESFGDISFVDTNPQARPRVTVTDGIAITGVDIRLKALASISGRVYRANDKEPIAGARVIVNGWHWIVDGSPSATTDAVGRYTVTGLNAGESAVAAMADGYISRYYDGVYSGGNVTKVITTFDNNTPNVDFALEWGGSISGHVYQSDGITPVHEARVWFEQIAGAPTPRIGGGGPLPPGQYVVTAADGSYIINGLNSGDYQLSVSARNLFSSGTRPVSVSVGKEITGVDFALISGGSLSGHVFESDGRTPIPMAGIGIFLQNAHYMGGYWEWHTNADSNGAYTFSGIPPGEYRVHASAAYHVSQYYRGVLIPEQDPYPKSELTVIVLSGQEVTSIDFALAKSASSP